MALYTNQLVKFTGIKEVEGNAVAEVMLQDGIKRDLTITKSENNKIIPTTKEEALVVVKEIAESKFEKVEIELTDSDMDSIEDALEAELENSGETLDRSGKRKRRETMEVALIEAKKQKRIENYVNNFFNTETVQADGVFLDSEGKGAIQFVADPRFPSRNLHSSGTAALLDVKVKSKSTKEIITPETFKDVPDTIVSYKINNFSNKETVKPFFDINQIHLDKIIKNKGNTKINNLLFVIVKDDASDIIKNASDTIKAITKRQRTIDMSSFDDDMLELKEAYKTIAKEIETNGMSDSIELYPSIVTYPDKIKQFIEDLSKNMDLSRMSKVNKDMDIDSNTLPLEATFGFKIPKKDGHLHPTYNVDNMTQLYTYSYSQKLGVQPNFIEPATSRGFVIPPKNIDERLPEIEKKPEIQEDEPNTDMPEI